MHEVRGPHLIDALWHCECLRLVAHQALSRPDPQVEFQLFVDAVQALVIPVKASDVAQIQVTQSKAPVAVVVGQAQQPVVGHIGVLCILGALVSVSPLAHAKLLARHPYAHTALAHCSFGHLQAVRWPHHFFSRGSTTISGLSFSSRHIFSSAGSRLQALSCATSSTRPCRHIWPAACKSSPC